VGGCPCGYVPHGSGMVWVVSELGELVIGFRRPGRRTAGPSTNVGRTWGTTIFVIAYSSGRAAILARKNFVDRLARSPRDLLNILHEIGLTEA
jgi:hypothetical protein